MTPIDSFKAVPAVKTSSITNTFLPFNSQQYCHLHHVSFLPSIESKWNRLISFLDKEAETTDAKGIPL